ncbi:SRPBCC family protein [Rhodanobacter soli]|uniref:SRPBCC family protein n=1 Tax=Rhodanobacter soli TaxID=590609 RepID=UPI0031D40D47
MSPSEAATGPLAQVDCQRDVDGWTLVFARELPRPPERVWDVLTDPAQLRAWSPYTANRNLGAVGDASLSMLDSEQPDIPTTVTRAEPPRVLEYSWQLEQFGRSVLRWELEPSASGTRLTLRQTIRDQDWIPKVAAGWHLCLFVAERLLQGRPVAPIIGEIALAHGWAGLRDAYAAELHIAGKDPPHDH